MYYYIPASFPFKHYDVDITDKRIEVFVVYVIDIFKR